MALFVVAFFALTSCAKTDDRDQFVGDYSVKVTGTYVITVNGQNYSEPVNVSSASMSIYKATEEPVVSVSGYYACSAYVIGNTISMDPMTGTQTQDGVTTQLVITPRRGTLNGNVLSFLCDVTGTAYYQGSSFPVSGTLYNEAIKR
jgi:hypothetical protein